MTKNAPNHRKKSPSSSHRFKATIGKIGRLSGTAANEREEIRYSSEKHPPRQAQPKRLPPTDEDVPVSQPAKRVRRVGKVTPRKISSMCTTSPSTDDGSGTPQGSARLAALSMHTANGRVMSKHDEKWNAMFNKLLAFKEQYGSTRVPQCYIDSKLGRWVHYQRVEYWIYQQTGAGKITPERIERLEQINFEWDPQQARWDQMFEKMKVYQEENGNCRVPKGYLKDAELANWVRNQRLEYVNMLKGSKNRMTHDRYQMLSAIGFQWSIGNNNNDDTPAAAAVPRNVAPSARASVAQLPPPPAAVAAAAILSSAKTAAAVESGDDYQMASSSSGGVDEDEIVAAAAKLSDPRSILWSDNQSDDFLTDRVATPPSLQQQSSGQHGQPKYPQRRRSQQRKRITSIKKESI